jgi:hypothetical protein
MDPRKEHTSEKDAESDARITCQDIGHEDDVGHSIFKLSTEINELRRQTENKLGSPGSRAK